MFDKFFTKSFGLDISDYSVEALELEKSFAKGYKVKAYSRIKLETGLVENGKILQLPKLATKIQQLLDQAKPGSIKNKHVSLSLPESQVYTSVISLPADFKDDQIQEAIENQIPEIFPLEAEQTKSTWQVLSQNKQEKEILIAAIDIKTLNQYYELALKLKLKIISLEMESIVAARAVVSKIKNNEGVLLLDFGARTSTISIIDNKGLFTTYNIGIAGQNFTEEISQKLKLSLADAEKIKISSGLSHKKEGKILLIIQSLLQKIIPEVKKSSEFFKQKADKNITQAYIVGGSSLLPNLKEYLADNLKIDVIVGNPFTKVTNHDIIKKSNVLFANVMGLALRNMDKKKWHDSINFIK